MIGDIVIHAYDAANKPILGNLDGQALLRGHKDFRRTNAYKRLKHLPKEKLSLNGRAVRYLVWRLDRSAFYEHEETPVLIEEIFKP